MSEQLRSVCVEITVDTNKRSEHDVEYLHEDETLEEFILRISATIRRRAEVCS